MGLVSPGARLQSLALEDLEFQDHQASSFQTLVYLLAVWTKLMFQNQVGEHQEK